MLTKKDIEMILEKVKEHNLKFYNEKLNVEIKLLDLSDIKIEKNRNYGFIDSSYINGIIGPYSYIYARAVIVSPKFLDEIAFFDIIADLFVSFENSEKEPVDINNISALIAKSLEYSLARKYSDLYIFMDGSIISDAILYSKFKDKLNYENIESIRKKFIEDFSYMLNKKLISIAKRILHSNMYGYTTSDMILLLNKFPEDEFYTEISEYLLSPQNKKIYISYFRARKKDHIYRIEALDNISKEEFKEIIFETIYKNKSYPKYLKVAHNLCKVNNKEKLMLENILRSLLGYSFSVGWETK